MKINAEESGTFIKFPAFPCAKKKKKMLAENTMAQNEKVITTSGKFTIFQKMQNISTKLTVPTHGSMN